MDVVTGAIGSLLPKLRELLVGEYKLQTGVKKDVESLEREMMSMNAALIKVAEVPRDQLDKQVIIWADKLRELSYDMEEAVDNFLVCVEGSESDAIADSNKLKWLVGKMASLFKEAKARHHIANAIKDIKKRAQEVAHWHDRYKVDDAVAKAAGKDKDDPHVLALYKDRKELVGIEDARDEVTKRLTDGPKQQQQHKMKIVSIVAEVMDPSPISASLGAMGSLPRKLDELLATRHWALRGAVTDEIKRLAADLHTLYDLLAKLSEAQDPSVAARYWMKDVRELSYDMVDCADQFVRADDRAKIRRATRRRVITRLKIERLPKRWKWRPWITDKVSEFRTRAREATRRRFITRLKIEHLPKGWKWRPWITDKVSEFRTRAQEATQRYGRYLFDDCVSNSGYSGAGHELPTVLPDPGDVVGIEGRVNELHLQLTSVEEQLKVVSIVGVGGIGKTTLAQKLWGKLHGQFECQAFVRTAQKPDMRGIIRSILSQVRRHQPPNPGEMHHLIRDLREYLSDKRYLVIIDDLWATSVWDVLSRAFPEGNFCSRILTTTEIMEVALACCGFCPEHIFKMEPLSDDHSQELLLQRIPVSGNQQFDNVLPQIKRNCGGLPLAIIIAASLLARQPEKLEQLGRMQNSFGAIHTMEGFMGQILNISFNSLPHYLKTCLLYLSTYPKGCLFLKGDLVKQWVAEGFICAKEGEDMEEIAGSYFDELVSTGLIQAMDINYNYAFLSYSVHHMVLDLITYKSIEENFITVMDYSQTAIPVTDKVRRLSLHFGSATCATTPSSIRLSQVRSLFFSGLFTCVPSFMVFKLLRVLVLHFWDDIGNSSFNLEGICELFWLRYLQVKCNVTVKLPGQIEPMKHLETLEINAGVCAVPPDIVRLSNLLHLRLQSGTNLPEGVECMTSLRTLMYFDLGSSSEDNIWGLGELINLRDLHLTYSSSPSTEHLKKKLIALVTSLGKLGNLISFTLASGTPGTVVLFDGSSSMYSTPVFLERLELLPPICVFSRFPKWIGQLHKLCILKIAVRELPMNDIDSLTGLHSLRVLSLCVQTAPERGIVFSDGAFPVLKYFKFRCGVLCMAFMSGAMHNLRRLKLCFNTHIGEKYDNMLVGVEHLLNLQDIAGQIGAATESDRRASESAFKDAISKHPRCPNFNVKWVNPIEEEYHPSEKQHRSQERGLSGEGHEVLEKAEATNKYADEWLSQNSDLPSSVASCRLKSESKVSQATEVAESKASHATEIEESKASPVTGVAESKVPRAMVDDAVANAAGKHKVDPRVLALYRDPKELVGIEDAQNEITKRLTDGPKQQQQHKMKIVSIVGPGGLGKTTLARAVYNRLQAQFEYKAFVPMGRNPEVKKVLRDILLEVDKSERMGDVVTLDEKQLIDKLRQLLKNGRYFIVIDDIWDLKAWEYIKCAFIDNNDGSRVITTTRILHVATYTGDIYKLKPLSQHLSEELFYTRLFGGKDKCLFDQPAEVSKKVLQKCGGVPLAIITIASLLAGKPMEDWSKVFNSIGFGSGDNNTDVGNMRKILLFSYYDLPCHLRSCLLHLSTYPEDYLINKNKLIWQWVAEGFVSEEPGVSLFETGERYFNELSNRSLIQPVEHPEKYTIYACRMHDMVLDMICVLSKKHNFVTILDSNEEHTPSQCNARRLAVQKRVVPLANMSMPKLRSWYATMCDPNVVPSLSNFQVLRVLAMEKCSFERDRPYPLEHIGRLPQLRYLSLESTNISKLPEEIGDLKFLQTLNLRDTHIKELPQRIGLLRKLKCLRADVYGDAGITVSNWIGNLTSLEELYLHTADKSSIFVKELRKLTELRVLICKLTARMDECWKKTFVESLCNLRKIQVLELRVQLDEYWKGYEPSRQLRDLFICGSLSRLPAWINSLLLPNLSSLDGQLNEDGLGEQDVVNLGSLPELTCLGWMFILRAKEFPDGAFPKLRSCRVCAPFRFLQGSMQSLEEIEIIVEVRALKDARTDFDFIGSLGNLPSLRKVKANFINDDAYTSDYVKVRESVRKAIDSHPNRPTLVISTQGWFLDYDFEEESDSEEAKEESDSKEAEQEGSDDEDEDEEESDSESEQESNRPVRRLTESTVDVAGTSPLVPALKKRKFACLNLGSSSSAASATAGSKRKFARLNLGSSSSAAPATAGSKRKFARLNLGSSSSAAPATAGSKQCGASGQEKDQAAEDDNETAQP